MPRQENTPPPDPPAVGELATRIRAMKVEELADACRPYLRRMAGDPAAAVPGIVTAGALAAYYDGNDRRLVAQLVDVAARSLALLDLMAADIASAFARELITDPPGDALELDATAAALGIEPCKCHPTHNLPMMMEDNAGRTWIECDFCGARSATYPTASAAILAWSEQVAQMAKPG